MGLRDIWIVNQEMHLECPRAYRHPRANISHADDAECLTGELRSGKLEVIAPAVFVHRAISRESVTR